MNFYNFFNKTLIFSFLLLFANNIFCMQLKPEEFRALQIENAKIKAESENLFFTPIEQFKTIRIDDYIYYYSQSKNKIEKVKILYFDTFGRPVVSDSTGSNKIIPPQNILGKVRELTPEELKQREHMGESTTEERVEESDDNY
ncbi:MAG: hypothetical protein WC436_02010 [Candidatus Babeliales bacterium]